MDISAQAEVFLREVGYDTWAWSGTSPPVTCFEDQTIVGFVHVFDTVSDLLERWREAQRQVLLRYAGPLRLSGSKSWNVYSVFLTSEKVEAVKRELGSIEEDFTLTRKIARSSIQTNEDLVSALLPLSSIISQPVLSSANFEDRLRSRAKDIPADALKVFLNSSSPEDVLDILGGS